MFADVVVDLQYGDCGKGKVTHHLCKSGEYTHVVRYNGGCNAGHTIYHEGEKFVTHHIPSGVFFGIKSIIGPGCVVNPEQFFKEYNELKDAGLDIEGKIFIAENAHIITHDHLNEDGKDTAIGTTKRGNGPAYRDKYARKGLRAKDIREFRPFLINLYEEFFENKTIDPKVLFEGAQGFGLDIDWGDYPYVTSSHCTVGSAVLNGIPQNMIRNVWGVAKAYETYVGAKKFHNNSPVFDKIREIGEEYGATTGRPRQCNWMDWELLCKAVNINGVNNLVINKMDVLQEVKQWTIKDKHIMHHFDSENDMMDWISLHIPRKPVEKLFFSGDKEAI